jgi:cation-transporting P-type ATPase 13A2
VTSLQLVFVIPSGIVFLIVGSVLDRFKALMLSHCPVHDATRVELLLVKVTSTKLKGKVVQTSYSSRSVCQLEKHGDLVAFEAFGVRYVYLGESTASPPAPQFMAIGKHVMSGVTMAAIDKYVTLAHAAEKSAASSEAFELPYSKANLSADSAAEQLVRKCQPLSRSKQAISIIGKNYIPIEVPSFPEAWIEELARPFYVFQFLCCVLWTIDNYIPYGYGLMFLLLLGSSQGAYVTIKSKKDMKKLVDKKYDVRVLRRDADNSPAASWASMKHVELLPGDIIKIQAGSPVPADCILVRGSVLMDESMLTGEALPLSKSCPEHMDDKVYTPMMKKCTLYADTLCLKSNDAVAIVGKTGMFTMKGELLQALIMPVQYQPQYQKEANFALFLMFLYSIWNYVIVVFLEFKNSPDAQFKCANFIYGLEAIAMVIPPILPLAVLIGLNMSVARLNKRNIFTFQVNRIGIIGGTKIMCFDKTGTITEDGMRFKNVRPVAADSGAPCFASSDWSREQLMDKPESLLANAMATCHSLEELNQRLVGNQVDMEMFGGVGFQPGSAPKTYTHKGVTLTVVKQFEFIHALQTMAVIVRDTSGAHHAFCKGSYERIKSRLAPSSVPADYDAVCTGLAKAGAYVLAMAGKSLKGVPNVQEMAREELECDLTLLGLLVFLNDVKDTSPAAFKSISDGGIDCKIITGDNAFTAVKVARSIAMNQASTQTKFYVGDVVQQHLVFRDYDTDAEVPADKIHECVQKALVHFHDCIEDKCPRPLPFALCVTGAALQLFDNQLRLEEYHVGLSTLNMVPAISIFARVSPAQKAEIVTDIEEAGAVVGMCGDGGNDVNALRQATFGFALSTTDAGIAAPFSTDRKDLTSLVELLIEGRTSLTTNFGAFKFMLTYGLFYSFYNLANNFHGGYFATKQFYWMDFGINLLLTIGVTSSDPSSTLIKGLPPSSIYSLPVQLSIWAPCVISAILLIVLKYWTTNQPWYTATETSFADGSSFPSDAQIQGLKSRNYLSTVYFHACSWSLIVTGFIYTFGGYFRQPVWRNKVLMISLIALVVVSSIMILLPSKGAKVPILKSDLADPPKLFEVNGFDDAFDLYPLPESFKVELFFLVVGFMAAMAFTEQAIIILFQKIDGKSGWNRFLEQLPGDEREILDEISFYE